LNERCGSAGPPGSQRALTPFAVHAATEHAAMPYPTTGREVAPVAFAGMYRKDWTISGTESATRRMIILSRVCPRVFALLELMQAEVNPA
jgi:hypothetical protein